MAFCGKCGKPLPDGSIFCPACGAPASKRTEEFDAPRSPGQVALSSWMDAPQQNRQQPQAKTPQPKRSKLPFVAIGAGAVMLVAALMLFVTQPAKPQGSQTVVADSSEEVTSVVVPPTGMNGNDEDGGSSDIVVAPPQTDTSSEPTTPPQPSAPPETTPPSETYTPPSGAPTGDDFRWLTGEAMQGNVPDGAKRITDLGSILGGWKGYIFGNGWEWFFSAEIDAGQSNTVITLDWIYAIDETTAMAYEDDTPDKVFRGTFDGGMFDATGEGHVTLAVFWEDSRYQYAIGSFTWPDGDTSSIALVRLKPNA